MNYLIYKITVNETILYIGSTYNFSRRKASHRFLTKHSNSKFYSYLRENAWEIDIIEQVEENINPLLRERYYIELYKPIFNKNIPMRTDEEYKTYSKNYRDQNKDYFKKKYNQYKINNKSLYSPIPCSCGGCSSHYKRQNHLDSKKHKKWVAQKPESVLIE
jgi:predicted GIY-YIG superfamily endonuclease